MGRIKSVNPSTNEVMKEFDIETRQQVNERVKNSRKAFESWGVLRVEDRIKYFKKLGRRLQKNKQKYAELMAMEMGKPLKEGIPEIDKCSLICEYYSRNAKKFLRDEHVKTEYKKSYIRFEPLGVVGSIMPWNFPFWQPLRFAVPALIAGNTEVLKHSSTVTQCALAIEQLFEKCKFPDDVFQVVVGDASSGTALVEGDINMLSLTGSTETGSRLAQIAMRDMKKVVLELGGSDPFIVLQDADIDKAAAGGVAGRFLNCGQSCIAAKRFIVVKEAYEQFTDVFVAKAKTLKVGDPLDPQTDVGPMVNASQLELLEGQIAETMKQGGKMMLGGRRLEGKGNFFQPTVIGHVTNDMALAREEAFGPAAPIIKADSEEHAIKIANETVYGLGASVWTQADKGEQITRRLNTGIVYVNKNVRSDPRLPFGGVKKSGIGRELARYGLLEMCNIKSVIVN